MELRNILIEYKQLTEKIINAIRNNIDDAEKFILLRQEKLNKLKLIEVNKEELKNIIEELGLKALDDETLKLLTMEKAKINKEIIELKRKKEASQVYNNSFKNINFVNKRI